MSPIQRYLVITGLVLIAISSFSMESDRILRVASPNGWNELEVIPAKEESTIIQFSVIYHGETLIKPSTLRLLAKEIDFSGTAAVTCIIPITKTFEYIY